MKANRWIKKTGHLFGNAVLVLLTAVALLLALTLLQSKLTGGEPAFAGYRVCIVMSGSMEPAVKTGSAVLVQPLKPADVRAGDIITFRGNGGGDLTTHRVDHLSLEDGLLFYTKGDANNCPDPLPVSGNQLVGKVAFTVPVLGYILFYLRTREGLLAFIALAVLIAAGGLISKYRRENMVRKQKDRGKVAGGQKMPCESDSIIK